MLNIIFIKLYQFNSYELNRFLINYYEILGNIA